MLNPGINDATIRLLRRAGYEIVMPKGEVCCGALVHHMGKEEASLENARRNVDVWMKEAEGEGLDAVLITASGCGTTIKDYGFMLKDDPAYAEKAARVCEALPAVRKSLDCLPQLITSRKGVRKAPAP